MISGVVGIDFGFHWDEPVQLYLVNRTVTQHTFLPHFCNWPPVTFLLSPLAVLPRVLTSVRSRTPLTGGEFYLQARTAFLIVSALGGIWLYLGLRRRAGELGAAFGAATYVLSFQLAYHSRWIAPDAVMTMTVALFLWFFVIAWDSPDSTWRSTLPAVAAGLATATKYQGAVLMLSVLVLFADRWRTDRSTTSVQLRALLRSIVAFLVTFVLLTPGVILEWSAFLGGIRYDQQHYSSGHEAFKGAVPYNVPNHLTYLWRLTKWVVVSLPSHSPLVSAFVIALALLGLATLLRRELWFAIAVLSPCAFVVLYFSTLTVFIVRNFLILFPFLAFCMGIGVGRLAEAERERERERERLLCSSLPACLQQ